MARPVWPTWRGTKVPTCCDPRPRWPALTPGSVGGMRRRTFDLIASLGGLALAVVLLVLGVLFQQNANFAKDNVRDQLSEQQVFFPPEDALSEEERRQEGVVEHAGEQVDSAEKARIYADEYIALHLDEVAGGKTYSQVSAESRENPDDEELMAQTQTLFRGESLRGLLLTSYAFGTLGDKAQQVAVACFVGAGVFVVLAVLGLLHHRRTPVEAEI